MPQRLLRLTAREIISVIEKRGDLLLLARAAVIRFIRTSRARE
ncbi:MAG: hypothetical protein WD889_00470 [Candidatus Colwellbacteria bacterium]